MSDKKEPAVLTTDAQRHQDTSRFESTGVSRRGFLQGLAASVAALSAGWTTLSYAAKGGGPGGGTITRNPL